MVYLCRNWFGINREADGDLVGITGELDTAVDRLVANLAARPGKLLTSTKKAVHAATEDLISTADSAADVDLLLEALADPESRRAAAAYLERFSPKM